MVRISHVLVATVLAATATGACAQQASSVTATTSRGNKAAVETSFRQWQAGEASPFDLLFENVRWTIPGSSRFAGTYERGPFLSDLVEPFGQRLATPLKPTRWDIYEDGDVVIIRFEAEAPLITGDRYSNSYAWFFTFRDGEVVEVTAYLDMPAFEAAMAIEASDPSGSSIPRGAIPGAMP